MVIKAAKDKMISKINFHGITQNDTSLVTNLLPAPSL
jgi:hypothetical protein